MKSYVKPALEVISMKTAENIADDSIIKTIYTQAAGATGYTNDGTLAGSTATYDAQTDAFGSDAV